MNILLASTSTLFGGQYLEYIREEIIKLFNGADEIIFVPFARPEEFRMMNIQIKQEVSFLQLI